MSHQRANIMLGTAGHVDHGKTALVKLLTGCQTDRLSEEQRRGLTIELGFAPCRLADERILGIVDVPGHVDFIRNMVAGAQGVDVVILVVAADDGVMPQTREHLAILTLMGARDGLVALTKSDLVDETTLRLAEQEIRELLAETFLANAEICPVSNVTGAGYEALFAAMNRAVGRCRMRGTAGLFRMWAERTFRVRGFGLVVSGIPAAGTVRVGQKLQALPGGAVGRIRGIEVYGEPAEEGLAGECVALNIDGLDESDVARGSVLAEPDSFAPAEMFEAELRLLAVPHPLADYTEVHLHIGTAEAMARVAMLEGGPIEPLGHQFVQMRLDKPLAPAPGERFVIRATLAGLAGGRVTTIGGGRVLDVTNQRLRRRRPWTLKRLAARRDALDSPANWLAQVLAECGTPVRAGELARLAYLPAGQAERLLEELLTASVVLRTSDGRWAQRGTVLAAGEVVMGRLEDFHREHPTRLGLSAAELAGRAQLDAVLVALAASQLLAGGRIERHGELYGRAGRTVGLSQSDQTDLERIDAALRRAALEAPGPAELAGSLGLEAARCQRLLELLADRGQVVLLDKKVVMHHEAVELAWGVARRLLAAKGGFETVEFRDALGVSRKYAVPLLDYFDSIRRTVRSGSRRTPGSAADLRAKLKTDAQEDP